MERGELITPRAELDRARLAKNCDRMRAVADRHGVRLRPHLKTAKCVEVAELALGDAASRGITVSTLEEARYFAARGFDDLTYAVALAPSKIPPLLALAQGGVRIGVITDDEAVARRLAAEGAGLSAWIEVDSGGGRGGVTPGSNDGVRLAEILAASDGARLAGVLTHAGQSYDARSVEAVEVIAEQERAAAVAVADEIRAASIACPEVSVGSTPTALHARSLEGVTELRAGVYVFFDRFQRAIHSCGDEDLALSVVASVISSGETIWVDAGALALSSDRSMDRVGDGGYGLVTARDGSPLPGAPRVGSIHQEHGRLDSSTGEALPPLAVGTEVRIWPNHACMTAAMYDTYHVTDGGEVVARWARLRG